MIGFKFTEEDLTSYSIQWVHIVDDLKLLNI